MRRLVVLSIAVGSFLASPLLGQAAAAELKVLCSGAMRAVCQELSPQFEKSSGHKLALEFATQVVDEHTEVTNRSVRMISREVGGIAS